MSESNSKHVTKISLTLANLRAAYILTNILLIYFIAYITGFFAQVKTHSIKRKENCNFYELSNNAYRYTTANAYEFFEDLLALINMHPVLHVRYFCFKQNRTLTRKESSYLHALSHKVGESLLNTKLTWIKPLKTLTA